MRINIPEKGLMLTSAVKSEGGGGFSVIEFPHVMPAGASLHFGLTEKFLIIAPNGSAKSAVEMPKNAHRNIRIT